MLKKIADLIPGPAVAEDGTNLAQMSMAGGYMTWQRELHRQYGPIVRLWTGPEELMVSLADPELVNATKHLADRPAAPLAFFERIAGKENLESAPSSRERNAMSKSFAKLLTSKSLFQAHYSTLNGYVERLTDKWQVAGIQNNAVALESDLRRLSLSIMGYILCSQDFDSMGVLEPLVTLLEGVQAYRPETGDPALFNQQIFFLNEIIDNIMQREALPGCHDLLGMMSKEGFSEKECRGNLLLMLVSSMHTTPATMAFTLYFLAQYPEIARSVRRELDDVFEKGAHIPYERLVSLHYLTQVIKESLRYYPPTLFARAVTEEFELGGYLIPEGASLFYAVHALHWNPDDWPEPETFDPNRFSPKAKEQRPFSYVPFGVGMRKCIGMDLAMTEMRMILSLLLRRFTFDLVPDHPVVLTEKLGVFLCAGQDIRVFPKVR